MPTNMLFLTLSSCLETSKFPLDFQLSNITIVFKKCKGNDKKYIFMTNGLWYTKRYFNINK